MDIAILKEYKQRSERQILHRKRKTVKGFQVEKTEIDDEIITTSVSHVRRNKYPLSEKDSLCLVLSSCFFLIPACYALCNGFYIHFVISVITSLVSINYWRCAVPGWRASLDFFVAKLSFVIYFITGFLNIKDTATLVIAWPVCGCIVLFYSFSNKMWDKDCFTWVFYHMSFHLFVAIEQIVVLNSLCVIC
mmetsp:Transcript_16175/g.15523  ORF Transcript_16175/g.15523 Transcript_16175/m.15523 type:complete len:191 (+) Transcript_16175:355-927(+)